MAMDFPIAPTVGDLFQPPSSPYTYQWDGVGWILYGSALEREPGGMYLSQELDMVTDFAGGQWSSTIPLLANYDYEVTIVQPAATTPDQILISEFSADGGTSWEPTYLRGAAGGIGPPAGTGDMKVQNLQTGQQMILTNPVALPANQVATVSELKIYNQLTGINIIPIKLLSESWRADATLDSFTIMYSPSVTGLKNALRIGWQNVAAVSAAGIINVYRRNRALTFP